jgi:hypothetical protein
MTSGFAVIHWYIGLCDIKPVLLHLKKLNAATNTSRQTWACTEGSKSNIPCCARRRIRGCDAHPAWMRESGARCHANVTRQICDECVSSANPLAMLLEFVHLAWTRGRSLSFPRFTAMMKGLIRVCTQLHLVHPSYISNPKTNQNLSKQTNIEFSMWRDDSLGTNDEYSLMLTIWRSQWWGSVYQQNMFYAMDLRNSLERRNKP